MLKKINSFFHSLFMHRKINGTMIKTFTNIVSYPLGSDTGEIRRFVIPRPYPSIDLRKDIAPSVQ